VVFALDKTGFKGFDSYGPDTFLDLAMVTMWLRPVPPVSVNMRVKISNQTKSTFSYQQIIVSILQIDMGSFGSLETC
jgi:hypothetical protein